MDGNLLLEQLVDVPEKEEVNLEREVPIKLEMYLDLNEIPIDELKPKLELISKFLNDLGALKIQAIFSEPPKTRADFSE